jgi:cytoplasmic tRNA 2-thiolation protein 2
MSIPLPPHIQSALPSPSHPHHSSSSPSLTPLLCYACHTTLTSRSSRGTALQSKNSSKSPTDVIAPLPVWVSSRLLDSVANPGDDTRDDLEGEAEDAWQSKKMDVREMRNVVKGFLLED